MLHVPRQSPRSAGSRQRLWLLGSSCRRDTCRFDEDDLQEVSCWNRGSLLGLRWHFRFSPVKRVSGKGVAAASTRVVVKAIASDPAQLRAVREDIKTVLREKQCHPIRQYVEVRIYEVTALKLKI